jgi:hypothetical protein
MEAHQLTEQRRLGAGQDQTATLLLDLSILLRTFRVVGVA